MNLKRLVAALAVLILLTGVADADDILDVVLTESLECDIIDTEIALEDLEIESESDFESIYASPESDSAGTVESNRQKTITVRKDQ